MKNPMTTRVVNTALVSLTSLCHLASAANGPIPNPTHVAKSLPGGGHVPGGNFENPSITTFEYLSEANGWTLGPGTGVVKEGKAFAAGHDFDGAYGLFLQNGSSNASRSLSKDAGTYVATFLGAQRKQGSEYQNQIVELQVDGQPVFEQELEAGDIRRYVSKPFHHGGGSLSLRFDGNQNGGDASAVIDSVRLERVGLWHEDQTWVGNSAPSVFGNHVNIPAGVFVAVEDGTSVKGGHIHVEGDLSVVDRGGSAASTLRCMSLLVDGDGARFFAGSELVPFMDTLNLYLHGNNRTFDIQGFGNKFIGSRRGGLLSLHGRPVKNYVELEQTAAAGADRIIVSGISGWEVGDDIFITATDGSRSGGGSTDGWDQTETRTIQAIVDLGDGRSRLELDSPLDFRHVSRAFSTKRSTAPAKTWRYEILSHAALIDRSIKIEGFNPGSDGFGGHVMVMGLFNGAPSAGHARIADVHFLNMGQKSLLGRYPFHWHMLADDGKGQYLKNCSVIKSFNRVLSIHGTHQTNVTGNVALDHLGHGVFLEDGSEEDNVINENLIAQSRKPAIGEEIIPTDNSHTSVQNQTPSAFWVSNPKNTIERNIAAGTEGTGYWFIFNTQPTGLSASDSRLSSINPKSNGVVSFKDNLSHSSRMGFDVNDAVDDATLELRKNQPWKPTTPQDLEGFRSFSNDLGLYTGLGTREGDFYFVGAQLVDNTVATMFASYNSLHESLVVATTPEELSEPGFLDQRSAFRLYDGPARIVDCHFRGYDAPGATFLMQGGGAVNRTNWLFQGSSFAHAVPPRIEAGYNSQFHNMDAVVDVDGTLGVPAGSALITPHPILRTPFDPVAPANWSNFYLSDNEFASMLIAFPGTPSSQIGRVRFTRVDSVNGDRVSGMSDHPVTPNRVMLPIVNSSRYTYEVRFPDGIPSGQALNVNFRDCVSDDAVTFVFMGLAAESASVQGIGPVSGLAAVNSASETAYALVGNDLYLKYVRGSDDLDAQEVVRLRW